MKVHVESILNCSPEQVWSEVQKSSLLLEVIKPLARVTPLDAAGFPERWQEHETIRCRLTVLGIIPVGTHVLQIKRVDPATREIESREHDALVRRWNHLIRVRSTPDGRALYVDEIEISAGFCTVLVWLFASWFYRHRQRRWRRVAERLAQDP